MGMFMSVSAVCWREGVGLVGVPLMVLVHSCVCALLRSVARTCELNCGSVDV